MTTAKSSHGGKRPNAGRKPPEVAKVRISTWVLPSTRAALGTKPGAKLDADYSPNHPQLKKQPEQKQAAPDSN